MSALGVFGCSGCDTPAGASGCVDHHHLVEPGRCGSCRHWNDPWASEDADAYDVDRYSLHIHVRPRDENYGIDQSVPVGSGETIDEIVVHDCMVHVEQMNDRCWWIGIYKGDLRWSGNFSCYRHKDGMAFTEQDAELPWGRDEEHR